MLRVLSSLLGKAGYICRIGSGCVIVALGSSRGIGGVGNAVGSSTKRPVVNTGMVLGKSTAMKDVASVSNGFSLSIPDGTALRISCVNCGARSIPVKGGSFLGVALGRSARALSRIIIMNCNSRGGIGIVNSVTSISDGTLRSHTIPSISGVLANRVSNIAVARRDNGPKRSTNAVHVHNINSFKTAPDPLILMSKLPNSLDSLAPTSVSGVSILGSTSSTTVCNSHTTGNIVLMAAGGKGRNGTHVVCGNSINVDRTARLPRLTRSCRCTRFCGGTVKARACAPRVVRGCHSNSSPSGCTSRVCLSSLLNNRTLRAGRRLDMDNNARGMRCVMSLKCLHRGNLLSGGCCGHCGTHMGLNTRLTGGLGLRIHLDNVASSHRRPSAPNSLSVNKFGKVVSGTIHFPNLAPACLRGNRINLKPGLRNAPIT